MIAPRPPLAVALVLSFTVLATACGGQSKEDFIADADEICRDANQELADIDPPQGVSDVPEYAEEAKDLVEETYDKLDDLDPPDDVEGDFRAYLDNVKRSVEELDRLKRAGESGNEAAVQEAASNAAARGLGRQGEEIARRIGFDDCGRINPAG